MYLNSISLQNFRNYDKKEFKFGKNITLIVGPNTSGKSNLIEAIYFLATGRSFRTETDEQLVEFEMEIARINGQINDRKLDVMLTRGGVGGHSRPFKKYLINGVSKRKADFVGNFFAVLFAPSDLDIIVGSPSKRRDFINNILVQADRDYRLSLGFYEKGLRIRNALLHKAKETGVRKEKEFIYWDNLLITQGQKITKKREDFIEYLGSSRKDVFNFEIFYDKSIISKERLLQYKDAEIGAGVTLVGPHRDNLEFRIPTLQRDEQNSESSQEKNLKDFGSRGQQRLAILQLKILELSYIKEKIEDNPVLLLDDIFSELDEGHINLVLDMARLPTPGTGGQVGTQQTIMTTTHEEFIPKRLLKQVSVIELRK